MENASKALIIAASVLLAIMVVSLGLVIFNKAKSSQDTTSLDESEITMFNSKFERYAGNQNGSHVKSLISFAISNASVNKDEPSKLPAFIWQSNGIKIDASPEATALQNDYITPLSTARNKIKTTSQYTVTLGYGTSGLINSITITP